MNGFEEKKCSVIRSEWIPGDYQVKQGVKGGKSYKGWRNGSWYETDFGTQRTITPTQHKVTCKDESGNVYTANVTQAAHRNGEARWTKKKADNFIFRALLNGIELLCSQYSNNAYVKDESFIENSKQSPEFGIEDLNSKNSFLGDDYTEFK